LLTQLTSSPHFYHYLYLVVLLLAVFNISEIVFLLLHKRAIEKDETRKASLKHTVSTAIITVTDPAAVLPKPADAVAYAAYSESVASILESFEGEIAERASRLMREFEVDLYYKQMARTSVWYKRANAIDILSSFRMKTNREFFLAVFRSETSDAVKYRILYGLSLLIRGQDDIYDLVRMLSTLPYLTSKYTEDIFFNTLSMLKLNSREDEFGAFLRKILKDGGVPALIKRDCLSACHAASCEQAADIVRSYFLEFRNEPEILIVCVKALVRMGNFDILHESLFHPDWRVRLAGLKHIHLSSEDVRHELKQLLHDRNYHIRVNAALALARLKEPGLEILRAETASGDKFAADAAAYALNAAEAAR